MLFENDTNSFWSLAINCKRLLSENSNIFAASPTGKDTFGQCSSLLAELKWWYDKESLMLH